VIPGGEAPTPLIYWVILTLRVTGDLPLATQRRVESIASDRLPLRRRDTLWVRLGESPLAKAVEPLARLAAATERTVPGDDIATISARRQLNDLPDELWTKMSIEFYKDPADAVFKALVE
jgi:predicted ATP-dependent Lon-type protease